MAFQAYFTLHRAYAETTAYRFPVADAVRIRTGKYADNLFWQLQLMFRDHFEIFNNIHGSLWRKQGQLVSLIGG